ncbi:MAG: oxygen-independent coproporphyrinogen III oxidase [Myxococcota bacterium]
MTRDKVEVISPNAVPKELLDKHTKNAPRYTSYPTAPQFSENFDQERIKSEWKKTNRTEKRDISLYLHIPFCRTRCRYCGCFTETGHTQDFAAEYAGALLREADFIHSLISPERKIEQFALGGGTPTFLSPNMLRTLIKGIYERFGFAETAERSIEIDPRSVDENYLDILLELGFNRFSFGVQDLDRRVQEAIGRIQDEGKIAALMNRLRKSGINAINLDIIHGLPEQTEKSFGETIDKVINLKPSRIALFGYAHVPWVSPHQKALEQYRIPEPAEKIRLFGLAFDKLIDAGYCYVGMDHFALPDDELIAALTARTLTRNFMGYTTRRGLDLVALGASSISSVGLTYTQNTKDISGYAGNDEFPKWQKAFLMNDDDELRREIIIDMFCNFYLDFGKVEKKFGVKFEERFERELSELSEFEGDGLLRVGEKEITVTPLGRFFIRNICMVFDAYIKRDPTKRYSKTF